MTRALRTAIGLSFSLLLFAPASHADDSRAKDTVKAAPVSAKSAPDKYIKISRDSSGSPLALETSVTSLVGSGKSSGVHVDLYAAVHIAEKSYFEKLNKDFKQYDAVLFELIAPEMKNISAHLKSKESSVSMLQNAIKDLLGLQFQLEEVDYGAKNFVHADLSPDAFMDSFAARGESVWTLLARLMLQSLAEDQKSDPVEEWKFILALMNSDDTNRIYKMRSYLALNMGKMDELVAKIEGEKGSPIIADRNSKAVAVLGEQMKLGKKKFAIFYGGAHMPDMSRRLNQAYGFNEKSSRWMVAWTLKPLQAEKK